MGRAAILLLIACGVLLAGCINQVSKDAAGNLSCVTGIERKMVRGDSMEGLVEKDSIITAYFGYYRCNEVKRGDIVLYNFTGDPAPLLKVAKGVPGDIFSLLEENDTVYIIINNQTLTNAQGLPYKLSPAGSRRLALYVHSYPVLPANTYLIMGNLQGGSLDSTKFGLIDRSDLLGKAVPENPAS